MSEKSFGSTNAQQRLTATAVCMAHGVRSASTRHQHHAVNRPVVNKGLERTITKKLKPKKKKAPQSLLLACKHAWRGSVTPAPQDPNRSGQHARIALALETSWRNSTLRKANGHDPARSGSYDRGLGRQGVELLDCIFKPVGIASGRGHCFSDNEKRSSLWRLRPPSSDMMAACGKLNPERPQLHTAGPKTGRSPEWLRGNPVLSPDQCERPAVPS